VRRAEELKREIQREFAKEIAQVAFTLALFFTPHTLPFEILHVLDLLHHNHEIWKKLDPEELKIVNDALRPYTELLPLNWPQFLNSLFISWLARRSFDPNDKLAPAGYGDAAFIQSDNSLPYTVRFENQADAGTAREIVVTDVLDANLDLDSFEITEIAFADQRIAVPSGLSHYETTVAIKDNGTPIRVEVTADLDRDTRQFTLTLRAVDPVTGWSPEDPTIGFLYPNDATGRGQGSVSYRVKPKSGLPSGAEITNRARIFFDTNDPIDTPLVRNTLDAAAPTSEVASLPATTASPTFTVTWSGQDDTNGSGIARYDLYVKQGGGIFAAYITGTPLTSFTFTLEPGHTYEFYSMATDNVGHRQIAPAASQTIEVANLPTSTTLVATPNATTGGSSVMFTATVTPAPNAGGTVTFRDNGAAIPGGVDVALVGGVAVFSTTTLSPGNHPVTASFSGTTGYLTSVSGVQIVSISAAVPAPSVLNITPNGNSGPAAFRNNHSRVVSLTVLFNQPVQLDSGAMALSLHTNNVTFAGALQTDGLGVVPVNLVLNSTDNVTWTISFAGEGTVETGADGFASLIDGVYDLKIDGVKVHPLGNAGVNMAGVQTKTFHRLFGDTGDPSTPAGGAPGIDFEAVVNSGDNLAFRNAFNKPAGGGYQAFFDFNGDGVINTGDNLQFRNRFNKTLSWRV
jgi:hypothetical protein